MVFVEWAGRCKGVGSFYNLFSLAGGRKGLNSRRCLELKKKSADCIVFLQSAPLFLQCTQRTSPLPPYQRISFFLERTLVIGVLKSIFPPE